MPLESLQRNSSVVCANIPAQSTSHRLLDKSQSWPLPSATGFVLSFFFDLGSELGGGDWRWNLGISCWICRPPIESARFSCGDVRKGATEERQHAVLWNLRGAQERLAGWSQESLPEGRHQEPSRQGRRPREGTDISFLINLFSFPPLCLFRSTLLFSL